MGSAFRWLLRSVANSSPCRCFARAHCRSEQEIKKTSSGNETKNAKTQRERRLKVGGGENKTRCAGVCLDLSSRDSDVVTCGRCLYRSRPLPLSSSSFPLSHPSFDLPLLPFYDPSSMQPPCSVWRARHVLTGRLLQQSCMRGRLHVARFIERACAGVALAHRAAGSHQDASNGRPCSAVHCNVEEER